jgi:putative membrane protein
VGTSILRVLIGGVPCALAATECAAHVARSGDGHPAFDTALTLVLLASGALYARGVARLWRKAGMGRGICIVDAGRFALGMGVLATALLSPIDALAERSFAVHMVEHEMLMVLAAPLLVLARPLEAWVWGLPDTVRRECAALVAAPVFRRARGALSRPVSATCVHALALWVWHVPGLFAAAQANLLLHVVQHACFFGSALVFWWAMFGGAVRIAAPVSLACLFATMLHTSVLGALLTFAPAPRFVTFADADLFGLPPLEDQQLGGLIMWVPGGIAYVVVALVVVGAWLAEPRLRRGIR